MSTYTRWYTTGVASATKNSVTVTGTGTYWKSAGLNPGDMITFDGGDTFAEIQTVNSDTSLTLGAKYAGATVSGVSYAIVRNFTSSTPAQLAANAAELLNDFRQYVDTDMQRIQGKSAYEIAVKNGYSGTESQWLESLKSAGEIVSINSKLDNVYPGLAIGAARNNLFRHHPTDHPLGATFSDAQAEAISSGNFNGFLLGDRWKVPNEGLYFSVIGFDHFWKHVHTSAIAPDGATSWVGINDHHLIVEYSDYNDTESGHGPMLSSDDDVTKGFTSMYIYREIMPKALARAEAFFGADHILGLRTKICDAMTEDGTPTHFTGTSDKIFMLTPSQLIGHPYVDDKSFYSNSMRRQFPLYRYMLPRHSASSLGNPFAVAALHNATTGYFATHDWDRFEIFGAKTKYQYRFWLAIK